MIDIRKLKELVKLMVENDLTELDLDDKEEKVVVKRGTGAPVVQYTQAAPPVAVPPSSAETPVPTTNGAAAPVATTDDNLVAVESPMVGTYYSKANPDAKPFISVGAAVSDDSVVCLIEAMKVFNEIKAECSGTVERVLVKDGDAVEFGQTMFMIRPA